MDKLEALLTSYTITELAEILGVARKTIYRWLAGESSMRLEYYLKIKELYDRKKSR